MIAVGWKAKSGEERPAAENGDDKILTLPEHVKHHILSFSLSIKKITDFEPWLIMLEATFCNLIETRRGNEYSERFIRFVDDALMRCRDGMRRFRLHVCMFLDAFECTFSSHRKRSQ
ncbi:hypothetical protein CRG98_037182 [Punica granatum]|uniref:Uncharacterized protein n=1 Tax=Punica granatum TaxID=22663 RepID=A0A2I0IEI4_PUNGR|nr:hypothetical protein CRG98_037182 [Punica granatum]